MTDLFIYISGLRLIYSLLMAAIPFLHNPRLWFMAVLLIVLWGIFLRV